MCTDWVTYWTPILYDRMTQTTVIDVDILTAYRDYGLHGSG